MTNNNSAKFSTADLALAAALSISGFVIEEVVKDNSPRANFIFSDYPALQMAIKKYWRNELSVNPQAYFNELKVLKSRIYGR